MVRQTASPFGPRIRRQRTRIIGVIAREQRSGVGSQWSVVSDWGSLAGEGIVRRRGQGQEAGRGLRDCRNARLCGGAGLRECGRQGGGARRAGRPSCDENTDNATHHQGGRPARPLGPRNWNPAPVVSSSYLPEGLQYLFSHSPMITPVAGVCIALIHRLRVPRLA